jgi:hypothetical protein
MFTPWKNCFHDPMSKGRYVHVCCPQSDSRIDQEFASGPEKESPVVARHDPEEPEFRQAPHGRALRPEKFPGQFFQNYLQNRQFGEDRTYRYRPAGAYICGNLSSSAKRENRKKEAIRSKLLRGHRRFEYGKFLLLRVASGQLSDVQTNMLLNIDRSISITKMTF